MPTWVIANSSRISMVDWRIKYTGGLPVDPDTKGYFRNGMFVARSGKYQPAEAFHDLVLTPWLTTNRGIVFDRSKGAITSPWVGPTGTSAMFYILGSSASIKIQRMRMFVPPESDGSRFIPVCFLTAAGFKSDQLITAAVQVDGGSASIPSEIEVSDLELDGTYMGWLGVVKDSRFQNVRSLRYGDLQGKDGNDVGGVGKWFAPPHPRAGRRSARRIGYGAVDFCVLRRTGAAGEVRGSLAGNRQAESGGYKKRSHRSVPLSCVLMSFVSSLSGKS